MAWAKQDQALLDAKSADWLCDDVTGSELHYCPDHHCYVCVECGLAEGVAYALGHEGMCDRCWGGDA